MIANWLVGPQLIGFIFIIAGWIQSKYPPKKINNFYGYRMPSALSSQAKWDEAQVHSGKLMMKLGLIYTLGGMVLAIITYQFHWLPAIVPGIVTIFAGISAAVLLIVFTERHLSRMFKD